MHAHTCTPYLKAHVLRRARGTSIKALLRLFQGAIKALSRRCQGAIKGTCDTAELYLKAHVLGRAHGILKRLPDHLALTCLPREGMRLDLLAHLDFTSLLFSAPEAWMVGEHSRLSLSGEVFVFLFLFFYFLFFMVFEQSCLCLSGAELGGIFSWALNCTV